MTPHRLNYVFLKSGKGASSVKSPRNPPVTASDFNDTPTLDRTIQMIKENEFFPLNSYYFQRYG